MNRTRPCTEEECKDVQGAKRERNRVKKNPIVRIKQLLHDKTRLIQFLYGVTLNDPHGHIVVRHRRRGRLSFEGDVFGWRCTYCNHRFVSDAPNPGSHDRINTTTSKIYNLWILARQEAHILGVNPVELGNRYQEAFRFWDGRVIPRADVHIHTAPIRDCTEQKQENQKLRQRIAESEENRRITQTATLSTLGRQGVSFQHTNRNILRVIQEQQDEAADPLGP